MNKIMKVGALAALVFGSVNMAQAATSATVTVTGSINTVSCEIAASQPSIDLGNHAPAEFTTAGAFVSGKTTDFSINVTGCSGSATGTGQAGLRISGPVTSAGDMYFSQDPSSQAAVGLALKSSPATLISNGLIEPVGAAGDSTTILASQKIDFTTGLISSSTNTDGGQAITAPLHFDFVYN